MEVLGQDLALAVPKGAALDLFLHDLAHAPLLLVRGEHGHGVAGIVIGPGIVLGIGLALLLGL